MCLVAACSPGEVPTSVEALPVLEPKSSEAERSRGGEIPSGPVIVALGARLPAGLGGAPITGVSAAAPSRLAPPDAPQGQKSRTLAPPEGSRGPNLPSAPGGSGRGAEGAAARAAALPHCPRLQTLDISDCGLDAQTKAALRAAAARAPRSAERSHGLNIYMYQ